MREGTPVCIYLYTCTYIQSQTSLAAKVNNILKHRFLSEGKCPVIEERTFI